jgi:2-haloacid dehalogenase
MRRSQGGGADRPKADALSRLWRQKQLEYTWLRSLMRAHADFWQVTGEALDYALAAHGIDDPGLRDELMDLYLRLDAYAGCGQGTAPAEGRGFATAILSNGSPAMLEAAVESAGIADHLDHVISIEEAGIFKPDPRVYELAVRHTGMAASAICFVSANTWDAQAAAHFGFQVARIDRFGLKDERIPGAPKALIKTLSELPRKAPGRLAEGFEQLHRVRIGRGLVLGMPLDAERKPRRALDRGRLDDAVRRARLDRKPLGEPGDGLAVQRVDLDLAAGQDRCEPTTRGDVDGVQGTVALVEIGDLRRPVVEPALATLDLAFQCAAQRHVELLKAAADAQQRHPARQHLGDERQGGGIAPMVIGLVVGTRFAAVVRRMDIGQRARQHDAREMIEQRVELAVADGRQQHGRAAGDLGHGAHIFVADRMEHQAVLVGGIGG